MSRLFGIFYLMALTFTPLLFATDPGAAVCKPTHVGSNGDVASLIACITTANTAATDTIIDLGGANYTLTVVNNTVDGNNGLPDIISTHIITFKNGSIERSVTTIPPTPNFRIFHIEPQAEVKLIKVSLYNGLISSGSPSDNGGAIYNLGELILDRSTLSHNFAANLGGAVYNGGGEGSSLCVKDSNISDNTALDSSEGTGGGGAIYNLSTLSIFTSTISDNKTNGYGAGINNQGTIIEIEDTTISGNRVRISVPGAFLPTGVGGGIYNASVIDLLVNSTIADNTAFTGGGIYNDTAGTIAIHNSTIARNIVNNGGGGIYNKGTISPLSSTIVANNIDTNEYSIATPDIENLGTITDESYNLIGNNAGVPSIVNGVNNDIVGEDPHLGPLENNGGLTFTIALLAASPAINNGDNPLLLPWDQREAPFIRVANGRPDIGAYEYQGCRDIDHDSVCDEFDNCPGTFNSDQLDSDRDSIGDECDNCPFEENFDQYDLDEDGIGNVCDCCTDSDDDGFFNPGFENEFTECEEDNCPFIFNPDQSPLDCKPMPIPIPVPPPPPPPLPVGPGPGPFLGDPGMFGMPALNDAPQEIGEFDDVDVTESKEMEEVVEEAPTKKPEKSQKKGSGCSLMDNGSSNISLLIFLCLVAFRNFLSKRKRYIRS